jgi:hypothetical protein
MVVKPSKIGILAQDWAGNSERFARDRSWMLGYDVKVVYVLDPFQSQRVSICSDISRGVEVSDVSDMIEKAYIAPESS